MNTYELVSADKKIEPGRAYRVIERDGSGNPYAAYNGYFNPKTFTWRLYPAKANFVCKSFSPKTVSALLVKRK